jgi:hypothetical protein
MSRNLFIFYFCFTSYKEIKIVTIFLIEIKRILVNYFFIKLIILIHFKNLKMIVIPTKKK